MKQSFGNDYSWQYSKENFPGAGIVIETDTTLWLDRYEFTSPMGISLGMTLRHFKNIYFDIAYIFTKSTYNYEYTNGIGKTIDSSMNWLRHSIDIGVSTPLLINEKAQVLLGFGLGLHMANSILEPDHIMEDIQTAKDMFEFDQTKLNGIWGEYLYLTYLRAISDFPMNFKLSWLCSMNILY